MYNGQPVSDVTSRGYAAPTDPSIVGTKAPAPAPAAAPAPTTPFREKNPTASVGASGGQVLNFGGGGMVYANPSDNPNYRPPASPLSTIKDNLEKLKATLASFDPKAITGSSDAVVAAEKSVTDSLQADYNATASRIPDPETAKTNADNAMKQEQMLIDTQIAQQKANLEAQKANIEGQFGIKEQDLKQRQGQEAGGLSMGLARAGGYLGFSGSGTGTMITLQTTHDREISALALMKQQAINEAQDAFSRRDMALMENKLATIENHTKRIKEADDTYYQQTLQASEDARANITTKMNMEKFGRDKAMENLDIIVKGGKTPDASTIAEYSARTGIPAKELESSIVAMQNNAALEKRMNEAKAVGAEDANDINITELRLKYPLGQKFTINGKSYTGLDVPAKSGTDKILDASTWLKSFGGSKYALPFIGKASEAQAYEAFLSPEPPEWFVNSVNNDNLMTLRPEIIQELWKKERGTVLPGTDYSEQWKNFNDSDRAKILEQFTKDKGLPQNMPYTEREVQYMSSAELQTYLTKYNDAHKGALDTTLSQIQQTLSKSSTTQK